MRRLRHDVQLVVAPFHGRDLGIRGPVIIAGQLLDHFQGTGNVVVGHAILFALCGSAYLVAFALGHLLAPRLVDTSVWIEVFRKQRPLDLESLVAFDEVVVCLPIIQEILQGIRDEASYRVARNALLIPYSGRHCSCQQPCA